MESKYVPVTARRGFALGLSTGLVLASAGFVLFGIPDSHVEPQPAESPQLAAYSAAWHQGVTQGSLRDSIEASASLLPGSSLQVMLARAEGHRRNREFKEACQLFEVVAARGGMTADAWADYADAQASIAGRLTGGPVKAIEAALALDPQHPKALWLEASLAHEQHRYKDALATWRRLLAVVPPGSSDARIVEANIAEATRLASS